MQYLLILLILFLQSCNHSPSDYYKTVSNQSDLSTIPSQAEQLDLTSDKSLRVLLYRSPSLANIRKVTKIGTVNPQTVLENTTDGKFLLQSLKDFIAKRKKILEETEAHLRSEEASIKQLNPETKHGEERTKVFRDEIERYKLLASQFHEELNKEQKTLIQKFMPPLQYVTGKIAIRKGLDIVIDSMEGQPKWAKQTLTPLGLEILKRPSEDLTPMVIQELEALRTN